MKKIIVIGCPGSGKTVFSKKLAENTGLPIIHLDSVWWKSDRTHISRDDFDRRLEEIMAQDRWIIDGDYSRTYEIRFMHCDTVLFFDLPEEVCLEGIASRTGTEREDMPWTDTVTDPSLVQEVRKYRTENRPVVMALIEKYTDKDIHVFSTRDEAAVWLDHYSKEK